MGWQNLFAALRERQQETGRRRADLPHGLLARRMHLEPLEERRMLAQIVPVPFSQDDPSIPHVAYEGSEITLKAILRGDPGGYRVTWDTDCDGDFTDEDSADYHPNLPYVAWDIGRVFQVPEVTHDLLMVINVKAENLSTSEELFGSFPLHVYDSPLGCAPSQYMSAYWSDQQLVIADAMAVQETLWALHRRMNRDGMGADMTGWIGTDTNASTNATSLALQLFTANGRMPAYAPGTYHDDLPAGWEQQNDTRWNNDPYADTTMRMANYLATRLSSVSIASEFEANDGQVAVPNSDNNSGLRFGSTVSLGDGGYVGATGAITAALATTLPVLAGTNAQVAIAQYYHPTWEFCVQELVDYLSSAQLRGALDGGWPRQVGENVTSMEASSWVYLALQNAEMYGGSSSVIVNQNVKLRIPNSLVQMQNSINFSSNRFSTDSGDGNFVCTGGALVGARWLGIDALPDTTGQSFLPYSDYTNSELSTRYDRYLYPYTYEKWFSSTDYVDEYYWQQFLWAYPDARYDGSGNGNTFAMFWHATAYRSGETDLDSIPDGGPNGSGDSRDWTRDFSTYCITTQDMLSGDYTSFGLVYDDNDGQGTQWTDVLGIDCNTALAGLVMTMASTNEFWLAEFTSSPQPSMAGAPIVFEASVDSLASYEWDFDASDGLSWDAAGPSVEHTFSADGTYTVTLRVTDENGDAHVWSENVSVLANQPPVADAGGSYSGMEGDSIRFSAAASTDPNDDTLAYRWDFNNDGLWDTGWRSDPIIWHPFNDDYSGVVRVQAFDGLLTSTDEASVVISNVAPVGIADQYNVNEDGPLSIASAGVLSNDTDASVLDTLTAALVNDASHGTLSLDANGSFSYTPDADFNGVDTFAYKVVDDDGGESESTLVTININPVNDAPALFDSLLAPLQENQPIATVAGEFVASDPDLPNDSHTYTLVSGEGDTDNGLFTIAGNQLLTDAALDYETQSIYSVRVRCTDLAGDYIEQTLTIEILDASESFVVVPEDWPVSGAVTVSVANGKLHAFETGTLNDVVPPHAIDHVSDVMVYGHDTESDQLTIDFSDGELTTTALTFVGGSGNLDTLCLTGAIFDTVTQASEGGGAGTVELESASVSAEVRYGGVDVINDDLLTAYRVMGFGADSEVITLSDGVLGDGRTTVGSSAGETITFTNPAVQLYLGPGSGDDLITVEGLDSTFTAEFFIDGMTGADSVEFAGDLDFAGDLIVSTSGTITVDAAISTNDHNIRLAAGWLNLAGDLDAGNGTVSLSASVSGATQTAGAIHATNLLVAGVGYFSLRQRLNDIDLVAGTIDGSFDLMDADDVSVGSLEGYSGLSVQDRLALYALDGSISIFDTPAINDLEGSSLRLEQGGNDALLQLANGVRIEATQYIGLTADNMDLQGELKAPSVRLSAISLGQSVDLGAEIDSLSGVLALSGAELGRITADYLSVFAYSDGATMCITAPIELARTDTLHLFSGESITQTSPIHVSKLSGFSINGNVMLNDRGNDVDLITLHAVSGDIYYYDADDVEVGEVAGPRGIGAAGTVRIDTFNGAVTITDTPEANDIDARYVSIVQGGNTSLLELAAGAHISGIDSVSLSADNMNLAGTIATKTASLSTRMTSQMTDIGSETDLLAGTLELSPSEIDRITADTLQVLGSHYGELAITAPLSPTSATNLRLAANTVTQTAPITVQNLAIIANGGAQLGEYNDVDTFSAFSSSGGTINFTDLDGFSVGVADGLNGVSSVGGFVTLQSYTGDIVVEDTPAVNDIEALGLGLCVYKDEGAIAIDDGATLVAESFIDTRSDKMDLQGGMQAPIVTFFTHSPGEAIDLGSETDVALNVLELSDAELDKVNAETLRVIGSPDGDLTISSAITSTNINTLRLATGGNVSQTASINVPYLAVLAGGNVLLNDRANDVQALAIDAEGAVQYYDATGFAVADVENVAGVRSSTFSVSLSTEDGPITVQDTGASEDLQAASGLDVFVHGTEQLFTLASGATMKGAGVRVTANEMSIDGTIISTYSSATLRSYNGTIDLGATNDNTVGVLELSAAELNNISAPSLEIGDRYWPSAITVTQLIEPANTELLILTGNSTVSQAGVGAIAVPNLLVTCRDGVSLGINANDVDRLEVDTVSGDVIYRDSDEFSIGGITSFRGLQTGDGLVLLSSDSGDVVVNNTPATNDVQATNGLTISTGGDEAMLTIQSGADVGVTNGPVQFVADKMDIQGTVTAPGQIVSLCSRITGSINEDAIDLGSTTDVVANTLELSDAELDNITAGVLRIGSDRANDITITSAIDPDRTDTLHLITRGSLWQSGSSAIVLETNLAAEAGGVIALNRAPNEIDVAAMSTSMGTLALRERGGFEVGVVDGVAGINGPGISVYSEPGTTGDGSITIASASNGIHGNWMDIISGATLTIQTDADLDAATGNIMLQADDLLLTGNVSAPADRQVWILPRNAGSAIDLGSTADAADGVLELSDAELDRIAAGTLRIGSSGTGTITVTALLDPAGASTLHLIGGDSISQTVPLTVPYLAAEGTGSVILDNPYNHFDAVAGSSTTGSVKFRDYDGFCVGSVDSVEGVQAHDYANLMVQTGNITLQNTSQDYDVLAPAGIAVTAWDDEAGFEAESGASIQSANSVSVMADRMKLGGTIESRYVYLFTPPQLHQTVDLGSTTDVAPNTLELSQAELSNIAATTELQIGRWSDSVIITQPVAVEGANRLWLRSAGTISQTAPITQSWLFADATDSVILDASNDVDRVAIKSTSGDIIFNDVNGFLAERYDGTPAFNAINGSLTLSADTGDITLSSQSDVISAGGPVAITLSGPESLLELTSNATLRSGAEVDLTADKMRLLGQVAAPGQTVWLQSATAGNTIDLGSTTDVALNTLELSDAELDQITTGTLRIGSTTAGDIWITAPITLDTPTLHLVTAGGVFHLDDAVLSAADVAIELSTSVDLTTEIKKVAVEKELPLTIDELKIENIGELKVAEVDGIDGIKAVEAEVKLITHSPLTIDAPIVITDGGSITLIASNDGGDDDHLTINAPIRISGGDGDVLLSAGTNLIINDTGDEPAISVVGTGVIQATAVQATELAATTVLATESGSVDLTTTDLVIHGTPEVDVVADPETGEQTLILNGVELGTLDIPETGQITTVVEGETPVSPPQLVVDDALGFEGTPIALPIDAQLAVDDGSQTLSVKISGAPAGATLSNGITLFDEPVGPSGNWLLAETDLPGLTIFVPDSSEFSLTVTAIATTTDGASASLIRGITVHALNVVPVVTSDTTAVTINLGETAVVAGLVQDPGHDVVALTSSVGVVVQDGETWTWSYDSEGMEPGTQTVEIRAEDADGAVGIAEFELTVRNLTEISGRVFDDRDNDGNYDAADGDTPIDGVAMELVNEVTGVVTASTTADGGTYVFTDIEPGTYTIREAQPAGYFDGMETVGMLDGDVDNNSDSNEITGIVVGQPDSPLTTNGYDFAELLPASIQGLVWEDFDNGGDVDLGEIAIDGVTITLTGTDDRGNAVNITQLTDAQGIFEIVDLRPGTYAITETQPTAIGGELVTFVDGQEVLGVVNEKEPPTSPVVLGDDGVVDPNEGDKFSGIELVAGSQGINYNFAERVDGGQVTTGQTATIGFWQNKNGQALIKSLNGDEDSTLLAGWLANTFPNMYGALADANGDGEPGDYISNDQVADLYRQLFKRNGKTSPGGPPKLDAQVLAVAMASYLTKESLAGLVYDPGSTTNVDFLFTDTNGDGLYQLSDGDIAKIDTALVSGVESYGFNVTVGGVGSSFFDITEHQDAFGVGEDVSEMQIIDLLLATDSMSLDGLLYDDAHQDGDGDGEIDDFEELLRTLANEVYSAINEQGHN